MICDLPGRFSVLIGANGAGKTTLTDALYLAHPASRFPVLPRYGSATLAPERSTRTIEVFYRMGASSPGKGASDASYTRPTIGPSATSPRAGASR
ncbi:AAA family ATPase [Streptomyces sp. NPDC042898]|uniref:AAA family ATPase n=1 Tax=Streptomyces sp. NPDC042898 TaxID=3154334 RepID=UPI0033CAAB3F